MKSLKIAMCGLVGAMLAGSVSAAYVRSTFEGVTPGTAVTNYGTAWKASAATVVVTNVPVGKVNPASGSTSAVRIPTMTTVTNLSTISATEKQVWTDFWTIPRPFISSVDAAPTVDTDSSAMLFVSSNGAWWAVSGGSTNALTADGVVATDGSTWYRVSVLHNYTNHKWSAMVNGLIVATDKDFIKNTVDSHSWFSVENGGGNSSNVTWLDDVEFNTRVPESLTNSYDGDLFSDAWELMYFGGTTAKSNVNTNDAGDDTDPYNLLQESYMLTDPTASEGGTVQEFIFGATNAIVSGGLSDDHPKSIDLLLEVVAGRQYRVLGSATRDGAYQQKGVLSPSSDGTTNWTDLSVLNGGRQDYYYKLEATVGNQYTQVRSTNEVTYAVHAQPRAIRNGVSNFWVGITVDYGTNNTLAGTLGQQLARGLADGDDNTADTLTVFQPSTAVFYLMQGSRVWTKLIGTGHVTNRIEIGHGVLIQRRGSGNSDTVADSVFVGPMLTNMTVGVQVRPGWNFISWPYEGSNNVWNLTNGVAVRNAPYQSDRIWMYRNGQYRQFTKYTNGTWYFEPNDGTTVSSSPWGYMQLGDALFYTNAASSPTTWRP